MNISEWAIKRPVATILFFLIITLIGSFSYTKLQIDENPKVDFPIVVVTVAQIGASPTELETDVTKKVEDALVSLTGINHVTSTITDGASVTAIEYKIGFPIETALNDVRDAIAKIRQTLPQDINEPIINHPNFSGEPFATYSISSEKRSIEELSRLIDDNIGRQLLTVSGMGQVRRAGGVDREIRVELNPERLRALGLTADQISTQIKQNNIDLPGGNSRVGGQEQTIRTLGAASDVERLKNIQIPIGNGQFVRLDALGKVEDSIAEIRQIAKFDGKPVVAFSLVRAEGASVVAVEDKAIAKLEKLQKELPQDIKIEKIRSKTRFTRDRFHSSVEALVIGTILAIIIIYVFLRNFQATLIGSLAIPLSLLGTFIVMNYLDYTLNFLTMLGLILAVGILVDDAIVDLENIHRHIAMGKNPFKAAIDATAEIGLAVVATTFTIVAVFVPVAFMGGIPGQFFRSFGLTVAISVLFSLLVARTLTPMMGAYLLPEHGEHEEKETWLQRVYGKIILLALKFRIITTIGAILISIGSVVVIAPLLPKTLFSAGDTSEAVMSIVLPKGSTLEDTEEILDKVTKTLMAHKEVKHIYASIGSGATVGINSSGGSVEKANVSVILVQPEERTISTDDFEKLVSPEIANIPGARIAFDHFGPGGSSKPVSIIMRSNDSVELNKSADNLITEMRKLPDLKDVTSSAAELRPEMIIKPDFEKAAEQGVSVFAIARAARIATQGDIDVNLPKFKTGDKQINIRVKIAESVRNDIDSIGNLMIAGRFGNVPLKSVASIYQESGPVEIKRYDRQRQIVISANLNNGAALGQTMDKVFALPVAKNLPPSVVIDKFGEAQVMADVFGEFGKAIGAAVMFVYAVLVLLFGSFMHPITIMLALVLSLGGAMAGLLIAGKPLGLMALIGMIMLMGIVTKNSILLVEYAILLETEHGRTRKEAVVEAGVARLRPILMTTFAMASGMLPIAMSWGVGTETQSPLAVAVMGGLISSTVMTLVVVPAAYTIIDDIRRFSLGLIFKRREKKKKSKKNKPQTTT